MYSSGVRYLQMTYIVDKIRDVDWRNLINSLVDSALLFQLCLRCTDDEAFDLFVQSSSERKI